MVESFGDGIWLCDGPKIKAMAGFVYPTRMAVIELADGGLFVWSPIPLTEALKTQMAALGQVRHLVAPNSLHHLYIGDWQAAWPEARVHIAPRVAKKRPDLSGAAELDATADPDWETMIDQVVVRSNRLATEVVFFHRPSSTVLFTDLLQQFDDHWFSGWRGVIARLDLMVSREPAVPRKFRMAFKDRSAARAEVRRILDWPVQKVVMAHGRPVISDGAAFLRRAFDWLKL